MLGPGSIGGVLRLRRRIELVDDPERAAVAGALGPRRIRPRARTSRSRCCTAAGSCGSGPGPATAAATPYRVSGSSSRCPCPDGRRDPRPDRSLGARDACRSGALPRRRVGAGLARRQAGTRAHAAAGRRRGGFGFRTGRVWATHLAWSGNQVLAAERTPASTGGSAASELLLADRGGARSRATRTRARGSTARGATGSTRSPRGSTGICGRRPRSARRPAPGRAEHLGGRLLRPRPRRRWARSPSARRRSASSGSSLDDGWFRGRRDDTTGLGDWDVDADVWPDGLGPAGRSRARARHGVRALVRAGDGQPRLRPRPRAPGVDPRRRRHGPGLPSRTSTCSTSATPTRSTTSSERMLRPVAEYGIDFIKWDHNRDLARRRPHARRPAGGARADARRVPR